MCGFIINPIYFFHAVLREVELPRPLQVIIYGLEKKAGKMETWNNAMDPGFW